MPCLAALIFHGAKNSITNDVAGGYNENNIGARNKT